MEECAAFSSSKKTISRRALLFVLGVWCVRSCTNQIHQRQGPACRRMRLRRAAAMTLDWDSDSTKEAREEGSAAADPLRLRFRFFWRLIANSRGDLSRAWGICTFKTMRGR